MKKIIVYLMLMSIFLMPIGTYAQEPYEFHGERTNRLYQMGETYKSDDFRLASLPDESVEKLAQEIEHALLQRKSTFTLHYSGDLSKLEDKINQAFDTVLLHNEYLSYDYRGYRFSGSGSNEKATVTFSVNYYQTAEQLAYVEKRIKEILDEIIHDDMNIHEKIKAVHDYIVLHVKYDTTYNQGVNAPYFALTEGKTLCNGYAMLVYQMLKELEIPVRLISGKANGIGHAWNLVQVDGEWYHLDATWDDPTPDEAGRIVYDYYMLTDEMIDNDHLWQEGGLNRHEQPYPVADADYTKTLSALGDDKLVESLGFHVLNDEFTSTTEGEFVSLVANHFNQMEEKFSIRYVTSNGNIKAVLGDLVKEAAKQSDARSWRYSWKEYSRTEVEDYIVTISNIDYHIEEVDRIEMVLFPESPLKTGENYSLSVFAILDNGMRKKVTDKASFVVHDSTIAEVQNGELVAKNAGSTTVDVSFQGKKTSFDIVVQEGPKPIDYPIQGYKPFGEESNVSSEKVWNVEFSKDVGHYLTDSMVYVYNQYGEKGINFIKLEDSKNLKVYPPAGGYIAGETYYLVIENSLRSAKEENLKEAVTYKFTISE